MPVNQYPGIPRHQIEHNHVQRMRRLRSPPLFPPTAPPMWPPDVSNLQPPMGHQAIAPPPSNNVLENRVDYNARLLENFNSTHQSRRDRRLNCRSSAAQSIGAQVGPATGPPPIPIPNVIDFQQEQNIEHRRWLELQEQRLHQQIEHQRQLELQLLA